MLQRFRVGLTRFRICQGLLDRGLAALDCLHNRLIQKPLEDPDQDQEIDNLQRERYPIECHGDALLQQVFEQRIAQ